MFGTWITSSDATPFCGFNFSGWKRIIAHGCAPTGRPELSILIAPGLIPVESTSLTITPGLPLWKSWSCRVWYEPIVLKRDDPP